MSTKNSKTEQPCTLHSVINCKIIKYVLRFICAVLLWAGFGLCFMLVMILADATISDLAFLISGGVAFIILVPALTFADE